jgi:hypothetical protein
MQGQLGWQSPQRLWTLPFEDLRNPNDPTSTDAPCQRTSRLGLTAGGLPVEHRPVANSSLTEPPPGPAKFRRRASPTSASSELDARTVAGQLLETSLVDS